MTVLKFPARTVKIGDVKDYGRALSECIEFEQSGESMPVLDVMTETVVYLGGGHTVESFIVAHWDDELAPFARLFLHSLYAVAGDKGYGIATLRAQRCLVRRVLPALNASRMRWCA